MQAILILLSLFTVLAQPVSADESAHSRAQDISDSIMSPFCPGRTLSGCASAQARELRSEIESWFERGKSADDVRQELISRYGEGVLGQPGAHGFGVLAWAAPLIFIAGGLLVVAVRVAHREPSVERPVQSDVATVDAAESAEVEQDIKNRILGG